MREIFIENCLSKDVASYISSIFPYAKKNLIFKAIRKKDIKVNGKRISRNITISSGDILQIYIPDEVLIGYNISIKYEYVDDNIVVVAKPQGIICRHEKYIKVGGKGTRSVSKENNSVTLEQLVQKDFKNAKLCHRLDTNTGGLVIFALNNDAYLEIVKGLKESTIIKEYIAYVADHSFIKKSDTLVKYIVKDEETGYCKVYDTNLKNSKKIKTKYTVLQEFKDLDFAILKIQLFTGRTHQIRSQMSAIRHPIIGDSKYGKNTINRKFRTNRQLLFAVSYTFSFKEDSLLYYLNEKEIRLNEEFYSNKIDVETLMASNIL